METKRIYIIVCVIVSFITSLTTYSYSQSKDKFVVVLDAGHGGGNDNTANGYSEKKISLKTVLELGKQLEKHKNIKVIYTRKKDVFVELYKRADIANKADADLFISIHCNWVANSKPYGTETFVLGEKNTDRNFEVAKRENEVIFLEDDYKENYEGFNPSSPESTIAIGIEQEVYIDQSIVLAKKIENNFKSKVKRKSRGLKQASLLVIRSTYMPSILVELGFLTNKKEGKFLNSTIGQVKMATAIATAIFDYKKELDRNVGKQINDEIKAKIETTSKSRIIKDVTFKVQIAASSKNLDAKPYNFKGLKTISKKKVGKLYKYFFGSTSDYSEVLELKKQAKLKGYKTSFVVAFKDGKQIPVSQALQQPSN